MQKRLLAAFAAIGLAVGLIAVSARYYHFVSDTIYEESAAHLTEIYHQVNQSLHNMVGNNWSTMQMWVPYLRDTADDDLIEAYIGGLQEEIGFTDFYFISREGAYQTISGENGYLDLKESLTELVLQDENVVVSSVVPGKPEIMVFAVPADSGTFRGFAYEAIAVSYNNSDLVEALEISAFDGQSGSYVVYPDGRVLVDNTKSEERTIYNVLSMLETYSDLSGRELTALQEEFRQGVSGVTTFRMENESYYLVYEAVEFENWIVLGIVPANVVNANMNTLQSSTLLLVSGITISLGIALLAYVIRKNRQSLKKKDIELLHREELFTTLSNNVDDVFLMLDADTFRVDYISPNIEKLVGISENEARMNIRELDRLVDQDDSFLVLDQLSDIHSGEQGEWEREYVQMKDCIRNI
ncbi:MAG: hypothetical protein SOY03_02330 [Bariatricus sp.]|nr:hypothetical protein [Bariatricus sp.]